MKRVSRQYKIGITFAVGQILDSDILAVFDKLYVLSRGGLNLYEGSVEHLHLFLREANVLITSSNQTPMERLIKMASKPNQTTLKLASQTMATRQDVLHMAQKYGQPAPNGIETPMSTISFRNIRDLFVRSYLHNTRKYWRSILLYLALIIAMTILLTTAFDDNIGQPNGCYNKTSNETTARFVIMGHRGEIDSGWLRQMEERKIDVIEGQHLIDENVKFLFVVSAGLCLFMVVHSVGGINEEVKVVINEHRNGKINLTL